MKDFNGKLDYKGQSYTLLFNLNVMEEIQEKYGTLEKWGALMDGTNGEPSAKAVKDGFTAMLNEGIDAENEKNGTNLPYFTTKQVGRIISDYGMEKALEKLNTTVIESTKDDSIDEKNA